MTWLAFATWQVWTVAAMTAAAVAWLFFLKLRHPRRAVPSLVLWQRALEQERPQSVLERLRRLISLLIILAVAWLLALAPGRPASVAAGRRPRPVTIAIDTAASMAARTRDGRTRIDLAKDRAREIIAEAGPAAAIGLIDTGGRVSSAAGAPRVELLRALDRIAVRPGADRIPAIAEEDGDLIVITDGVRRRPWPSRAERVSVFEPAVNVRLAAFDVRPLPAQPMAYQAYVEIVNESPAEQRVTFALRDARQERSLREIVLAPGGTYRDVLNLSGLAPGELHATVAASGDALALDDEAAAYLPLTSPIETLLVTEGNPPLETTLGLDPLVDLTTVRPSGLAKAPRADVIIFDRFTPAAAPASPALLVHPSAASWLTPAVRIGEDVPRPAVRAWDTSHPLLQFVSDTDIRIDRTARLDIVSGAPAVRVVAAADTTPLIVAAEGPVRFVIVGFDLRETDLPFQVGFPMLVRNAVVWLAGVRAPLVAAAGTVRVPWPDAAIRAHDGRAVPARRVLEDTVFEAAGPGLFFAHRGEERVPIVVGLDEAATGVNASEFAGQAPAAASSTTTGGREWWPVMLAVAFALAALEWVTFHRRLTL
jgi:hypothetical protein